MFSQSPSEGTISGKDDDKFVWVKMEETEGMILLDDIVLSSMGTHAI